ncbi:MAG: glycosyltransferase [Thermoplasmata archaeon]|nr:glycosyltransferase [Thermoplasmata archaeon]
MQSVSTVPSASASPATLVSVVVTVKNEARNIEGLLESLLPQEPPFEVVIVDALSHDGTPEQVREFARRHQGLLRLVERYGSRGIGRNVGVSEARGEFIAFIDGDCAADPRWLHELREGFSRSDVVAGRTVLVGGNEYGNLERVELYLEGSDVTYPSCNLGYRRSLFERLGGFDPRFITAEDIDLNLRAVRSGARIEYASAALVAHRVRPNLPRFLVQAFWNGYGRKQLTEKHGMLWGNYRVRRLLSGQRSIIAWARLTAAVAGYVTRILTGTGRRRLSLAPPSRGGPNTAEGRSNESPAHPSTEPRSA